VIEQMYDAGEVSEIFGVAQSWVQKWRKHGKLRSTRVGRLMRFSEGEIGRFQGIGCDEIMYPNTQVNEIGEAIGEFAEAQMASSTE
jgi:excisionase family DNA binding protein